MTSRLRADELQYLLGLIDMNRNAPGHGGADGADLLRQWHLDSTGTAVQTAYLLGGAPDDAGRPTLPSLDDIRENYRIKSGGAELPVRDYFSSSGSQVLPGLNAAASDVSAAAANGSVLIQSIWNQNHNYWVDKLKADTGRAWSEDEYFEAARAINLAEHQQAAFGEIAKALSSDSIGPAAQALYGSSGDHVHDGLAAGDALLDLFSEHVNLLDGTTGESHHFALADAFNVSNVAPGASEQTLEPAQTAASTSTIDVLPAARTALPGRQLDLASVYSARGRDATATALNQIRAELFALSGLASLQPYEDWTDFQIRNDLSDDVISDLAAAYPEGVNAMDLWVGGLAEKPAQGQLGSTIGMIARTGVEAHHQTSGEHVTEYFNDSALAGQISTQSYSSIAARFMEPDDIEFETLFMAQTAGAGSDAPGSDGLVLTGSDGDDVIFGSAGDDIIFGGAGDDILAGDGDIDDPQALPEDSLAPETSGPLPPQDNGNEGRPQAAAGSETQGAAAGSGNGAPSNAAPGDAKDTTSSASTETVAAASNDYIDGGAGNDEIYGGRGDDILIGGQGNDIVAGGKGDDSVHGGSGDDQLAGGSGNDEIQGGLGSDSLYGQSGSDVLSGGSGSDGLYGGSGNDILDGGTGADRMSGGTGNDVYALDDAGDEVIEDEGGGTDTVYATLSTVTLAVNIENLVYTGAGTFVGTGNLSDNTIVGGAGTDVLFGMAGDDVLAGGLGSDQLYGGEGSDWLDGDSDSYTPVITLTGGSAAEIIVGSTVSDVINAGSGADSVYGGAGADAIDGGRNDDYLDGGAGHDTLIGGRGNDVLMGGSGDDHLDGGTGSDCLDGGEGNDDLRGGSGDDRLEGGRGYNRLDGGSGDDYIISVSGNDTIVLQAGFGNDYVSGFDADSSGSGGQNRIDVSDYGLTADDLGIEILITAFGDHTVITIGSDTLTLLDLNNRSIDKHDFIFS